MVIQLDCLLPPRVNDKDSFDRVPLDFRGMDGIIRWEEDDAFRLVQLIGAMLNVMESDLRGTEDGGMPPSVVGRSFLYMRDDRDGEGKCKGGNGSQWHQAVVAEE